MTVYQNMALAREHRTKAQIDSKVQAAAKLLQLDTLHAAADAASGGQRQRVAIGRAIVRYFDLPFDEPLSNPMQVARAMH
jgi:multiple sugar transport system ATP-binding protein